MKHLSRIAASCALVLLSVWTVRATPPASAAGTCTTGLSLILHPGLPAEGKQVPPGVAPDIPHRTVTVSVPVYPGAQRTIRFVASPPLFGYPANPYLQTGMAEYQTSGSVHMVIAWYRRAFGDCGWRIQGSMTTSAGLASQDLGFQPDGNRYLTIYVSFGSTPEGGTYIGYAAEAITYPPRPAASYLHGPFSQVRIALDRGIIRPGHPVERIIHTVVLDRPTIARLVHAINAIRGYRTVMPMCLGGLSLTGPAWLTFVRPSGSVVHAYESGPGACLGLAVNGVRWLLDPGRVWNLITSVVPRTPAGTQRESRSAARKTHYEMSGMAEPV